MGRDSHACFEHPESAINLGEYTVKLFLDIETIPAQRPDVLEEITSNRFDKLRSDIAAVKPPGNYKKEETIVAWWNDEAPKLIDTMKAIHTNECEAEYRKTGLDGAFGQVCVIGFALDNHAPKTIWSADWANAGTERELLEDFSCALTDVISPSIERAVCVVGHNVANFDLRFLVQRSIVNGVQPHRVIASAAQAKPWESERCFDTMVQWAGVGRTVSLDKLCRALLIHTPKSDITGATVWDAVQAGRIAEVAEYCKKDVDATRAVYQRMTFQKVPL